MDARHHPFDVLSGSLLGILVAWGSYRQYFPPVSETWRKGRAYPIRSWGREPVAPPEIRIDEDTEPLRGMGKPVDPERGEASGFSAAASVPGGNNDHRGNVFREQISESQRRRQQETYGGPSPYRVQRGDTMSSTGSLPPVRYPSPGVATNPFHGEQRRRNRDDDYAYSSSDDDGHAGYELEETYTLSAPQNGVYNPVSGSFTDTAYARPVSPGQSVVSPTPSTQVPQSQQPPTIAISSDIADSKREPPFSPQHPQPPAGTGS